MPMKDKIHINSVAFFGTMSKIEEHTAKAKSRGFRVTRSVTPSTDMLVYGGMRFQQALSDALAFDIMVINEKVWEQLIAEGFKR